MSVISSCVKGDMACARAALSLLPQTFLETPDLTNAEREQFGRPWRTPTAGGCDQSRGCTRWSRPADGRSVAETTMRTMEVVMLGPGREMLIAFLGVEVMTNVGPFAQGGLDKAFGLAVGARSVGAGEAVLDCASESYETFAPRPRPAPRMGEIRL